MSGDMNVSGRTFVTYQQIQDLEASGKKLEFSTPEASAEFLALVADAKANAVNGGASFNPIIEIPAPTNATDLGLLSDKLELSSENLANLISLVALQGNAQIYEADVDALSSRLAELPDGGSAEQKAQLAAMKDQLADVSHTINTSLNALGKVPADKLEQLNTKLQALNQSVSELVVALGPSDKGPEAWAERVGSATRNVEFNLTQVLSLLHEMGVEMKKSEKEARGAKQEAQYAKAMEAAGDIRNAALASFVGSIVGSSMQMLGALSTIAGAASAAKQVASFKPLEAAPVGFKTATPTSTDPTTTASATKGITIGTRGQAPAAATNPQTPAQQTQTVVQQKQMADLKASIAERKLMEKASDREWSSINTKATHTMDIARAQGQILGAAGDIMKASMDMVAKNIEADKAVADADAQAIGYSVQNSTDTIQNLKDMIADVRQKLGEMLQAQSQMESRVWS